MTYNHGIWNQLDAKAGNAALVKLAPTPEARAAKAPTAREKAYLAAVEILYSGQGTKVQRDARYSDAMQALAKDYPKDNNAQLFYALSLMGRSEGVRDVPVYLRAGAIAERSFRVNPQNPGATHYWIHAMDEPEHAAGALEAARALSKIAPDAGHAQHMTSHIFMALGMWDDLVEANENAMRVVLARDKARGKPQVECGHYQYWLAYGYYQQGRYRAGDAATQACQASGERALAWFDKQAGKHDATAAAKPEMTHVQYAQQLQSMLVNMRATSVIESGDWNGPAVRMKIDTTGLQAQAGSSQFTDGYAAAQRGDLPRSTGGIDRVGRDTSRRQARYRRPAAGVLHGRARGRPARAGGDQARQGERRPALDPPCRRPLRRHGVRLRPSGTGQAAPRTAGEQLLVQGEADAARVEFEAALKRTPNRALSLLGLARAQNAAGNMAGARSSYGKLIANWHAADADLPALSEARNHLGQ